MRLEEGKYYRTRDGRKVGPAHSADRKYKGQDAFEVDGPHVSIHLADGTYAGRNCPDLDLIAEWTEGPVRTVTRREVVPGVYGRLSVTKSSIDGEVGVRIKPTVKGDVTPSLTSAELKAAAAVLLELAGALDSE